MNLDDLIEAASYDLYRALLEDARLRAEESEQAMWKRNRKHGR